MRLKKLLIVTGKSLYPIGEGGGETVAHDLLVGMSKEGVHCEAFGVIDLNSLLRLNHYLRELGKDLEITSRNKSIYNYSGRELSYPKEMLCKYHIDYPVYLSLGDTFITSLSNHMNSTKPDAVIIQAEMADQIINTAFRNNIFPIVCLHRELDIQYCPEPDKLPLVLVNSKYVQNKISGKHNIKTELLYPAINLDNYRFNNNSHKYITMINPVVPKGIKTFLQIAADMPDRQFLAVEGWGTPENILNVIRKFPNITYMPKQFDVREVYNKTHILLVPSQWEEPFGRVIIEAGVGGIPVIASKVGGIPEALGKGGILLDDYKNHNRWIEAIYEMEEGYDNYSKLARENTKRFGLKAAVSDFMDILRRRHGG